MGAELEDFTEALFVRDPERGQPPGVIVEQHPPYAAILAFPSVSPAGAADPVVMRAPYYEGPRLPEALERLEVHQLGTGGVEVLPARDVNVWHGMRWALRDGRAAG